MEEIEQLRKENENLKSAEPLLKSQLAVACRKIKKLEEYIASLENKNKDGIFYNLLPKIRNDI